MWHGGLVLIALGQISTDSSHAAVQAVAIEATLLRRRHLKVNVKNQWYSTADEAVEDLASPIDWEHDSEEIRLEKELFQTQRDQKAFNAFEDDEAALVEDDGAALLAKLDADLDDGAGSNAGRADQAKSFDNEEWRIADTFSGPRLSLKESGGFFNEPDSSWTRRKALHNAQMKVEAEYKLVEQEIDEKHPQGRQWWQIHYEPSFHCAFSERLGAIGEGGKWVCDPHRIAERVKLGSQCLVYSIGSRGEFSFEKAVKKQISDQCEIHVFDPKEPTSYQGGAETPKGMTYHTSPLGSSGEMVMGVRSKTMEQMVDDLGHRGRRIDLLKIDCEGCEWHTYKDWLTGGTEPQQILVELHWKKLPEGGWRKAHEFYQFLFSQGYVVANKEPNTKGCSGDCIEYGFIKLDPAFNDLAAY